MKNRRAFLKMKDIAFKSVRSAITEISKMQNSDLQEAIIFDDSRQRLCKGISSRLNKSVKFNTSVKAILRYTIILFYFTNLYLRITMARSSTKNTEFPIFGVLCYP